MKQILSEALKIEKPYTGRPQPEGGTPAAVLVLVGMNRNSEPSLLLTQRSDRVETHRGQIAFPGGVHEAADGLAGPGLIQAALRETEEEVGIARTEVEVVGVLPSLWTVSSGYLVTPVVGLLKSSLEDVRIQVSDHEIQTAFWASLAGLREQGVYRLEYLSPPGAPEVRFPIHVYQYAQHRIWGATGAILKNLFDRISEVEAS